MFISGRGKKLKVRVQGGGGSVNVTDTVFGISLVVYIFQRKLEAKRDDGSGDIGTSRTEEV